MITYGFFNSVNKDRMYNADSFNDFFDGIISETGVYKKSGMRLDVIPGTGMTVQVQTGRARIKGHWVAVESNEALELAGSDIALNRYDAIVLRYDASERNITLQVITGSGASTPVKPSIVRNENTYDICLAYVYVPAGSSSIATANIEDTKADEALCGYVKMQIDTVNAGIKEYRNIVTTTSEVTELTIGIPEFDSENDLLFSNIGGVMFVQGTDYTITGTGSAAKMVLKNSIKAGNTVEFRVIKAILEVL